MYLKYTNQRAYISGRSYQRAKTKENHKTLIFCFIYVQEGHQLPEQYWKYHFCSVSKSNLPHCVFYFYCWPFEIILGMSRPHLVCNRVDQNIDIKTQSSPHRLTTDTTPAVRYWGGKWGKREPKNSIFLSGNKISFKGISRAG